MIKLTAMAIDVLELALLLYLLVVLDTACHVEVGFFLQLAREFFVTTELISEW